MHQSGMLGSMLQEQVGPKYQRLQWCLFPAYSHVNCKSIYFENWWSLYQSGKRCAGRSQSNNEMLSLELLTNLARSNHRNFSTHQGSTRVLASVMCQVEVGGRDTFDGENWWEPHQYWFDSGWVPGKEVSAGGYGGGWWSEASIKSVWRRGKRGGGMGTWGSLARACRSWWPWKRRQGTHTHSQVIVSVCSNRQNDALSAKEAHVLISGTCEFVTLYDQRDTANVIPLRILRW